MSAQGRVPAPIDEETTELFDVLANERRQYIVHRLTKTEESIALADMARDIAARETDDRKSTSHEDVKQIRTQLHHRHVPKLCDHNVASYNQDQRTLSHAANTERAQQILTVAIG